MGLIKHLTNKEMGYNTLYKLTAISGGNELIDYEEAVEKEHSGAWFGEETPWYSWEPDMRHFSKTKHPWVTFLLEGKGDDYDDIWKAYFKNGKMFKAKAELVFEEFSEDKLN